MSGWQRLALRMCLAARPTRALDGGMDGVLQGRGEAWFKRLEERDGLPVDAPMIVCMEARISQD